MFVANCAKSLPITIWRNDNAVRSRNRLSDHRSDGFRVFVLDDLVDLVGTKQVATREGRAKIAAIAIGR